MQNIISDCNAPPSPANGAVVTSSGTTYGQQATYSCGTGYNLVGSSPGLCQADGNWKTAPVCQIVGTYNNQSVWHFIYTTVAIYAGDAELKV